MWRLETLLEPASRVEGIPFRLAENSGIAFIGCYVLGMGFVLDPGEAQEWIAADARNAEVLFPYLNGEDLNQQPDASASRWVIDFNDRDEGQAKSYELPYARVVELVKPERLRNPRKPRRDLWWQFAERAVGMRRAIEPLTEVLVIALVSKTVMPMRAPAYQVFSHKLGIFATASMSDQALLSSNVHLVWAVKYSSTLETRVNYSPSDVFLTFPRPVPTPRLEAIGRVLESERRELMLRRELGLTKLYNLVSDPSVQGDEDIRRLRDIHVEVDRATMNAYGWEDIQLSHGFHVHRQMLRWTISPAARVEVLDRLLEENLRRAGDQDVEPTEGIDEATDIE